MKEMAWGFLGGSVEVLLHQHPHKLAAGQPSQPHHQAVAEPLPKTPAGGWVTASEFNAEFSQDEPSVDASVQADRLQFCMPALPELRLQPVQPQDLVPASEVLAGGKQLSASLHLSPFKSILRRASAGLKRMLQEAAAEQPPSTPRRMPAAGRGLALLTSPPSSGRKAAPAAVRPSAPPPLPTECTPAEQGSGTAAGVPVEPSVTRKPVLKRAAAPMLGGKLKAKVAKLPGKAAGNGRTAGMGNAAGAGRQAGASKAAGLCKHAAQVPASTGGKPAPQPAAAISGTSTAAEPAANADADGSAKKSPPAGAPAKPRAKAADIDLAQTEVKLKEKQAACKLGELSIPQLKVLLKARKLLLGGKKADLITRLQGHLAGSQA